VDGQGGERGADHADRERDRAAVDELAGDARLLCGRRGIDRPDHRDDLTLGTVGTIDEPKHPDDEREQRDEPEEDLIGHRAGEEGAVVGDEAFDGRPSAREGAP